MTPRKPRKMPKNQRAYPKKGKPRLVEVTGAERTRLVAASDDIGSPTVYLSMKDGHVYVDADKLKKWRSTNKPGEKL
jgi:hypothetical protein